MIADDEVQRLISEAPQSLTVIHDIHGGERDVVEFKVAPPQLLHTDTIDISKTLDGETRQVEWSMECTDFDAAP
jgi:hypothetical protein